MNVRYQIVCLILVASCELLFAQKLYETPLMMEGQASAGKRVKIVPEGYEHTNVYHSLYLPKGHSPEKKYPIIVEYTGNYAPHLGSSGQVKDASLGYATAVALDAIWVVMPYLSEDGLSSELTWWGSESKTIDYCARQVKDICWNYGGDPSSVFITGFSRGAIAVNRLGLNDDRAADIWLGFHSHDHYDGHRAWCTDWAHNCAYDAYRASAIERALRFKGRAALVGGQHMDSVAGYISTSGIDTLGKLDILRVPVPEIIPQDDLFTNPKNKQKVTHTDKWMNYESNEADLVANWYKEVIRNKPGTFSITGIVRNTQGMPVPGVIVESGLQGVDYKGSCTHFCVSNCAGEYELKGLIQGERWVSISQANSPHEKLIKQNVSLLKNEVVDIVLAQRQEQNLSEIVQQGVKSIDIILLMGQSNMKGRGRVPSQQEIHPRIIYMNMTNDAWYPAMHPLHTDGIPDLLDGKSNAGVGPGLDFAKVLLEKDVSSCVALIPCAKGGSWIELWMPGAKLYTETVRRAQKALADFSTQDVEVNIKAALWLQGESDAKEGRYQVYETKLKTMVDSLRADLGLPDLPFISATIGTFMEGIANNYPFYNEINSTLLNAGNGIDYYRCVDAMDIEGHIGDQIHYNTASQEEIGKRMAITYLELKHNK